MKKQITVLGHSNSDTPIIIERTIKNGVVNYGKQKYRATESEGEYSIDVGNTVSRMDLPLTDDDILAKAAQILEDRYKKRPTMFLESPDAVKKLFQIRHSGLDHEVFDVAFLTHRHTLIEVRTMWEGDISSCSVYPAMLAKACLELSASAIILSHPHPSQITTPSQADIHITAKIKKVCDLIDVRVLDHIITSNGGCTSLAELGDC